MNETKIITPSNQEAVQEVVLAAYEGGSALEVLGGGTKKGHGHPVAAPGQLCLAQLKALVNYQPHELLCTAQPGIPLAALEAVLAEQGQMLAFEPPHWHEEATLGGVMACNLSGPRRFKAGAARDHLLGFSAITGRGEMFRGGGKVVKNVTGYDLSKLMCGSFGTLAVLTELCVKVLPQPETSRTVALAGMLDKEALALLMACAGSSHEPTGLAHLPPGVNPPEACGLAASRSWTLCRVEGPEVSVTYRVEQLATLFPKPPEVLDESASRKLWRSLRELEPLNRSGREWSWRLSVPATEAAQLVKSLQPIGLRRHYFDWAGGQIWAVSDALADCRVWHDALRKAGGHGSLVAHDAELPASLLANTPLSNGQLRLTLNLKQAFDPKGILNPGRMYPNV